MLSTGDRAPDFELTGVLGRRRLTFRLAETIAEKHVVLAFYPLDWTPT